jgi:hypothetical protein
MPAIFRCDYIFLPMSLGKDREISAIHGDTLNSIYRLSFVHEISSATATKDEESHQFTHLKKP